MVKRRVQRPGAHESLRCHLGQVRGNGRGKGKETATQSDIIRADFNKIILKLFADERPKNTVFDIYR